MVDPLLYGTLHAYLHQPVYIVGCSLVVGRLLYQTVYLFLRVALSGVHAVYLHPLHELGVVDDVFFEGVANLVDEVYVHVGIAWVHLATTLVDRHEDGLYAAGGLRHQRSGARGCYGQAGNVAASVLHHVVIQLRVGLPHSLYEGVLRLALGIVYLECATLASHLDARTVGVKRQRLMHLDRKVGGLLSTIAQAHGGYHVALGGNTHTRTSALCTLGLYLLPQVHLGPLHLHRLRVALHLLHDKVYLLQLQVYDVVHQALGLLHVVAEQLVVEVGILRKRVLDIRVEVDAEQAARVVGTQGYLATGICRHGAEAQVGIAVGDALSEYSVPEQHTGFGALPGVVHYLLPQRLGRNLLAHHRILTIDGELLHIRLVLRSTAHELVVNLHAHVSARHLALSHLCIDKGFCVGVLDADRQHQGSTTSVLGHLARTITIPLHKGHQSRRRQRRVVHRLALGTYVTQVVAHAAAPFHQLHLFLVNAQHATIRVGIAVKANDETVRQRRYLVAVANTRHRTAGRHYVSEVVQQLEHLLSRHRILVLLLYTRYLVGQTPVHLLGRLLVDIAERVLHRIFVHPYPGSQLVAAKVCQRGLEGLVITICLHHLGIFSPAKIVIIIQKGKLSL